MLYTRFKPLFHRLTAPPARLLIRCGVRPNHVTVAGLILAVLCCGYLLHSYNVLGFCGLVVIVGALDALDGAVARLSGRTTRWGAYLDAMADRYVEAVVVLSVAYVTGYWLLSLVVLFGALAVSYAKARAALEVSVSNTEWPDLFERGERSVLFIVGLAAGEVYPRYLFGHDLFYWTLVLLAMGTHLTVIQRMRRARRLMRDRQGASRVEVKRDG